MDKSAVASETLSKSQMRLQARNAKITKIVEMKTAGQTIRSIAEKMGLSRGYVQRLYDARNEWMYEAALAGRLLSFRRTQYGGRWQ